MREAKNNKSNEEQKNNNNTQENVNSTFNTLPGVDANLGMATEKSSNIDSLNDEQNINQNENQTQEPNQQMYGQNINQDPNQQVYGQEFNPDLNQMYGQNANQQMYGQNINQEPNQQVYGQEFNPDLNQMYGQNANQQMYGQNINQDPNQQVYGQEFNPDLNQMYGQNANQQMYGQNINQDSNQQVYGQEFNPDLNQMYGQNANQQMYGQEFNLEQNQQAQRQDLDYDQNQMYNQNTKPSQNQNVKEPIDEEEEKSFEKAWMGSLYDKANKGKFNIGAAFFQGTYLLYRKMYATGILVIVLEEIICILLALLININSVLAFVMNTVMVVLYFVGMGLGFYPLYKSYIKNKYIESRKKVNDPNQLQSIASKNGGTSIAGIFIGIIITTVILSVASIIVNKNIFKMSSKNNSNNNTNAVTNETEQSNKMEEEYLFFDNYYFVYDGVTWTMNNTNDGLISGNYTLAYKANYKAEALNADFSSQDSLASLLKLLTDSFTNQVAQLNMQVEAGSNNFIKQNNCYYAYIDVLASDSISRYYFVVLPEKNILFQFVLTAADTVIDYQTNLNVIDMITNIQVKEENNDSNVISQNEILNTIGNTLTNETSDNSNNVNAQNATTTNNNNKNSETQNSRVTSTNSTQNSNLNNIINNQ